ncbi:GTP-binding protein HSR1 [Sanguibacter sp. A247]|uniref:GTP-binding protein HSR1 n=1 Tax=unclassified Sanguibacter TaxID=2645534 RepID=UPI003FD8B4E9
MKARKAGLTERLDALGAAWQVASSWLPDDAVGEATGLGDVPDVIARVRQRLGVGADRTVVALAGSTGSGKSSMLNALAEAEVARPGILRPTTSQPVAVCAPGSDPTALLDWLDVRERTLVPEGSRVPDGVVLLDLPDHDSVEVAHRLRADRLLERADVMVWLTDPQKYADAALHDGYLRPLAAYGGVAVVVLNHADKLEPADRERVLGDLRQLVARDGLEGAVVLAASATTGLGLDELRDVLEAAADRRAEAAQRLLVDVRSAAERLLDASGGASRREGGAAPVEGALVRALSEAAGTAQVVDAVAASTRRQVHRAAGWPVTRWVAGFRADPLGRLGLGRGGAGRGAANRPEVERSSVPQPTGAVRARAAQAVREHVAASLDALPDVWRPPAAGRVDGARLADELDMAVVGVRLGVERAPAWARALGIVQTVALVVVVAGLAWVLGVGGLGLLGVTLPLPELVLESSAGQVRVAWPAAAVAGGVVVGLLVAFVASVCGRVTAARRARRARLRLEAAVSVVAHGTVLGPVRERLDALERVREHASRAAGRR